MEIPVENQIKYIIKIYKKRNDQTYQRNVN